MRSGFFFLVSLFKARPVIELVKIQWQEIFKSLDPHHSSSSVLVPNFEKPFRIFSVLL
jgi:hypothetical protein